MFKKAVAKVDLGDQRRVKVTNILKEGIWLKLYIQFDQQSVQQLERNLQTLSRALENYPQGFIVKNNNVFSLAKRNSLWCRVRVLGMERNEAIVWFIDYGVLNKINMQGLRQVDAGFFKLEDQAMSCYLADIAFSKIKNPFIDPVRVIDTCKQFLEREDITCAVIGKLQKHLVVRLYFGDISLSYSLLDKSYGTPVHDLLQQGTEEAKALAQWINETTSFLEDSEDVSESSSGSERQNNTTAEHSESHEPNNTRPAASVDKEPSPEIHEF